MDRWVKTFYGWHTVENGVSYNIHRYRRGDGKLSYVLRVNGLALTSPPVATTLAEAKRAAREHMEHCR